MLLLVSLFHRFLHFLLQTKTICFNSSPQIRVLFLEYLYSNNLTLGLFSKPMEIISIFSLVIVFHLNTSIPPPGITTLLLNFLCLEICYYFPIFSFSTLFYFLEETLGEERLDLNTNKSRTKMAVVLKS